MLMSENRLLQSAKSKAENRLQEQSSDYSQQRLEYERALQEHKAYVEDRDRALKELNLVVEDLHNQISQLTETNEELLQSNTARGGHNGQHFATVSRELEDLRSEHSRFTSDHKTILAREIDVMRDHKDGEIQRLRLELDSARDEIRRLQQRILESGSTEDLIEHDEDYFDAKCQELFKHLQSWVTRFSKLSDNKKCRDLSQIRDDALRDMFEDSILDGGMVEDYLQHRQRRRDVFVSVAMTLMFKHIFTRYLFGMDREHRQKLKTLDKTLQDVGPPSAVHKWRATTLALLSKRPTFQSQRDEETNGVVDAIWDTLSAALTPPRTDQATQCRESLRRVIDLAVDISIDMRLQRAEYSFLPPPEPQFDPDTGDVTQPLLFKSDSMTECSGTAAFSDQQLEAKEAYLRLVMFPLVFKSSGDEGVDDGVVVFKAQVHAAVSEFSPDIPPPAKKGKTVGFATSDVGDDASFADGEDASMEGGMF